MKIHEKSKKAENNTKSKGKRPKAKVSSHNACRYGYPFFLSPNDDDAMLEIPNPTPSVHQTPYYHIFVFVLTKKEKKHDSAKFSSKIKTQKQVKNPHFTIIPNPQKSPNIKNDYPKFQNHFKIYEKP